MNILHKILTEQKLRGLLILVTLLHVVVFIRYPFTESVSTFTAVGELMKFVIPPLLFLTLIPKVYQLLDRVVTPLRVNTISVLFIVMCVVLQVLGINGQAWSTVAFSGTLILVLFNNISKHYDISKTIALTFSFMVIWLGWVFFEIVFQVGLWFYHPLALGSNTLGFYRTMLTMAVWLMPALFYIEFATNSSDKKPVVIVPYNWGKFAGVMCLFVLATCAWFLRGMLIPIPVNEAGTPFLLNIDYWTVEHLDFSISRLSQVSIMTAFTLLFFRGGNN